jgi:hypothetical protein
VLVPGRTPCRSSPPLRRAHRSVRPAGIQGRAGHNIPRRCSCCFTEVWGKCGVRTGGGRWGTPGNCGRTRAILHPQIDHNFTDGFALRSLTLPADVKCTDRCRSLDLQIPPIAYDTVCQGQQGDPGSSSPRMIYTLSNLAYLNRFVNTYFDAPRRFASDCRVPEPGQAN